MQNKEFNWLLAGHALVVHADKKKAQKKKSIWHSATLIQWLAAHSLVQKNNRIKSHTKQQGKTRSNPPTTPAHLFLATLYSNKQPIRHFVLNFSSFRFSSSNFSSFRKFSSQSDFRSFIQPDFCCFH